MSAPDESTQAWSPAEAFADGGLSSGGPLAGDDMASGILRTGLASVDEAVTNLTASRDLPPAEQVMPLAQAHRALQETLDSIGDV